MSTTFKIKQEWLEAVMASDLSPATKVYAYGIFQHMYGNKEQSWPGATSLFKTTGLNDSQFYKYNRALREADYLEITSRRGTSNHYRLVLPTSTEGIYLPPQKVGVPPEEVGVTSTEGTNTTMNTTMKTPSESINSTTNADAPVVPSSPNYEVKEDPYKFKYRDSSDLSKLVGPDPVYVFDVMGLVDKGVQGAAQAAPVHGGRIFLTPGEEREFKQAVHVYSVTQKQAQGARTLLESTPGHREIASALAGVGVNIEW